MKQRFPPLWTWSTALAIVVLLVWLLGSSGVIDRRLGFGANYTSFTHRLAKLRADLKLAPEDKVVVVIGSSFTAMSVDHRPYFYERHQRERGGKLHVIKLYMYGCNADRLQQMPEFFEFLVGLKPDLVCLEEHLLAIAEGEEKASVHRLISNFHLGVEAIKYQLFPSVDEEERHDLKTFEFFWKYHDEAYGADSLAVGPPPELLTRTYKANSQLNSYLEEYLPASAQLVCLAIPRPRYVEEKLMGLRKETPYLTFQQAYQDSFSMINWTYPRILPYHTFSGDDHLNAKGMARFSAWLYEQIDQQLYP